jgi:hypothetical protein
MWNGIRKTADIAIGGDFYISLKSDCTLSEPLSVYSEDHTRNHGMSRVSQDFKNK